MARHQNVDWDLPETMTFDLAQTAVLMDIRDALQTLNRRLAGTDFINIPKRLNQIVANTTPTPRRKRRGGSR